MTDGELVSGEKIRLSAGDYTFNVSIGTGTSSFAYSIGNNGPFIDVDDSALSASGNGQIKLSSCRFIWTATGDARAWMTKTG